MREILGFIACMGGLFSYYYGGGKNGDQIQAMVQGAAAEYIAEYNAPVRSDQVVAFVHALGETDENAQAVFLTEDKLVYFDPAAKFNLKHFDIPLDKVRNTKFMGTTIYIHGMNGERIQLSGLNPMYARYFKDSLREILRDAVEPAE